ncbi:uncharacterized protein NEMAJ01_1640 [Nematocida major]|uniref:uncharacterized protein n=1 Tax=Nematocida major TaxID=1912982 RepID=UPI00200779AE|nr:uncharacterized protein NEMAJ01_1640 [Nematocida major]KAH9386744.1 hypothetical protein NEMAJ01_1640 [Nematocida major]
MSTTSLLFSIIQAVKPPALVITGKEGELRVFGTNVVDVHISASGSGISSRLNRTVEVRTVEFQKVLKECRLFSDIQFSRSSQAAKLCIAQDAYKLQVECAVKDAEEIKPPALNAEIIVDLDTRLLRRVVTKDAHSIEIRLDPESVRIKVNGVIKVEAHQKSANYIRKKEKSHVFIIPAEGFLIVSKICHLEPNRVLMGVVNSVSIFYLYFAEATVICYAAGTLLQV